MTRDWDSTEQHWDHCWLNVNNEDWWIGAVEMDWATGKRWLRLWRDEGDKQTAFLSVEYSRVDWNAYNKLAHELMDEAWGIRGWKKRETTRKTAPPKSTTTKRSRKRLLDG